jgi:hypothetical protein
MEELYNSLLTRLEKTLAAGIVHAGTTTSIHPIRIGPYLFFPPFCFEMVGLLVWVFLLLVLHGSRLKCQLYQTQVQRRGCLWS